jgi:hypothetical protein
VILTVPDVRPEKYNVISVLVKVVGLVKTTGVPIRRSAILPVMGASTIPPLKVNTLFTIY